jgi:N-acetylmuramoyl-L-alanine amidase CwlA
MAQAAIANRDTSVAELCKEFGIRPNKLYHHVDPKGNLRKAGNRVFSKP